MILYVWLSKTCKLKHAGCHSNLACSIWQQVWETPFGHFQPHQVGQKNEMHLITCPKSSAVLPAKAPGVSTNVMIGKPYLSACCMNRSAFLYPFGCGMPKLRYMFSCNMRHNFQMMLKRMLQCLQTKETRLRSDLVCHNSH